MCTLLVISSLHKLLFVVIAFIDQLYSKISFKKNVLRFSSNIPIFWGRVLAIVFSVIFYLLLIVT